MKADLLETGFIYTDIQLVSSVIRGLPGRYENFKDQ